MGAGGGGGRSGSDLRESLARLLGRDARVREAGDGQVGVRGAEGRRGEGLPTSGGGSGRQGLRFLHGLVGELAVAFCGLERDGGLLAVLEQGLQASLDRARAAGDGLVAGAIGGEVCMVLGSGVGDALLLFAEPKAFELSPDLRGNVLGLVDWRTGLRVSAWRWLRALDRRQVLRWIAVDG